MSISALIIDDEQLARDELKYLLDSVGGVEVVGQGANGIEAVDLIEEHHPDLVFLDVQMPGLDGFAVIKRLMERHQIKGRAGNGADAEPLPQIVFATAYDQYAVRAPEQRSIQLFEQFFEGAAFGVPLEVPRNNANHAFVDGRVADIRLVHQQQPVLRLHHKLGRLGRARCALRAIEQSQQCVELRFDWGVRLCAGSAPGQAPLHPVYGFLHAAPVKRLQQVVHSVHVKGAHRGFVVNIDHIREVVPWFKSSYQLRMNDKQQTEIPVSRAQTKRLRELFNL